MWPLFVVLLGIVLLVVFFPGLTAPARMSVLIAVLIMVVGALIYMNFNMAAVTAITADTGCDTCNGPPKSPCDECGHNPCKCAHALPGQKRCPKCPGLLGNTPIAGIKGCDTCNRNYRCPGCLLK